MNLKDYAILCKLSYTIKVSGEYDNTTENIDFSKKISKNYIFLDTDRKNISAIATFSNDGSILFIIIPGSDDIIDFAYNIDVSLQRESNGIIFHNGFYKQYLLLKGSTDKLIKKHITNSKEIHFIGHSSGGCVASIMAYHFSKLYDIDVKVVTFGAPVFTNEEGIKWFLTIDYVRIIICQDPIPRLPYYGKHKLCPKKNSDEYMHIPTTYTYKNGKVVDGADGWHNPRAAGARSGQVGLYHPDHAVG